jgi:hypothetical protein
MEEIKNPNKTKTFHYVSSDLLEEMQRESAEAISEYVSVLNFASIVEDTFLNNPIAHDYLINAEMECAENGSIDASRIFSSAIINMSLNLEYYQSTSCEDRTESDTTHWADLGTTNGSDTEDKSSTEYYDEESVRDILKQRDDANTKVRELESEIRSLQHKIDTYIDNESALSLNLDGYQMENAHLRSKLDEASQINADLVSELNGTKCQLYQYMQENRTLKEAASNNCEIVKLRSHISEIEVVNKSLKQKRDSLEKVVKELEQQVKVSENKANEYHSTLNKVILLLGGTPE